MPNNTGIIRTVNRYLNLGTGDPYPGASTLGYTGQAPQYAGQVGAWEDLSYAEAQKRSSASGTALLFGGRYQYVQFAADGTAYAQGQILYWKDETAYLVTNVPPTSLTVAGICLTNVTAGNYWFMQTKGDAQVKFAAGLTTPAIGQPVFSNEATPPLAVNAATAATAVLAGGAVVGLSQWLGVAVTAPVSSTITRVMLRGIPEVS